MDSGYAEQREYARHLLQQLRRKTQHRIDELRRSYRRNRMTLARCAALGEALSLRRVIREAALPRRKPRAPGEQSVGLPAGTGE